MGHTDRRPERESEFFDKVSCGQGDGILLVSTAEAVTPVNAKRKLPPIVAVLDTVENQHFPTVRVDHAKGAMEATGHLIALGHRRIAHITGPARSPVAIHRRKGFLATLSAAGIRSGEENCVPGEFTVASGEAAMASLRPGPNGPPRFSAPMTKSPSGPFGRSRLRVCRCPRDISVMGCDDQPISGIYDPPLTTIHPAHHRPWLQCDGQLARILAGEDDEDHMVLKTIREQRSTPQAAKAQAPRQAPTRRPPRNDNVYIRNFARFRGLV